MSDEQIHDLQTRLMHQEKLLSELNTLVFRQQKEIDRLTAASKELTDALKQLRDSGGSNEIVDTPPPHY